LVVETLEDHPLRDKLQTLTHSETETAVSVERKILAFLGGDCNLPAGVHVFQRDGELCCDVVVFNSDGRAMRMYITQGESSGSDDFADLIWGELSSSGVETFIKT
jgi:porphobilinogen deaminase